MADIYKLLVIGGTQPRGAVAMAGPSGGSSAVSGAVAPPPPQVPAAPAPPAARPSAERSSQAKARALAGEAGLRARLDTATTGGRDGSPLEQALRRDPVEIDVATRARVLERLATMSAGGAGGSAMPLDPAWSTASPSERGEFVRRLNGSLDRMLSPQAAGLAPAPTPAAVAAKLGDSPGWAQLSANEQADLKGWIERPGQLGETARRMTDWALDSPSWPLGGANAQAERLRNAAKNFGVLERATDVRAQGALSVGAQGLTDFSKLDGDGDGLLSRGELGRAINAADAPVYVATLHTMQDQVARLAKDRWLLPDDGISRNDLTRRDGASRDPAHPAHAQASATQRVQRDYADRAALSNGEHIVVPGAVQPEFVRQGNTGDCYFVASLAALAGSRPAQVERMVRATPDGGYEVQFPGEPDAVRVPRPSDAAVAKYASGVGGPWVSVVEQAWGELRRRRGKAGENAQEAAGGGGTMEEAVEVLTGRRAEYVALGHQSDDAIRSDLAAAMRDKRIVTMGSVAGATRPDEGRGGALEADGIVRSHAYSVLSFDAATDRVLLRNPWGNGEPTAGGVARDGTDDGKFALTVAELRAHFVGYAFETSRRPARPAGS